MTNQQFFKYFYYYSKCYFFYFKNYFTFDFETLNGWLPILTFCRIQYRDSRTNFWNMASFQDIRHFGAHVVLSNHLIKQPSTIDIHL